MNILTTWLREYLPTITATDRQLAEDLTLRGIAVEGVHPTGDGGHLFEMDITTNRVDAMNHYGVAREAAAIYGVPLRSLEESDTLPAAPGEGYPVRIEAAALCGRFTAQVIRGVTVAPSVGIVAERFAALGQKPISNAVDATNYNWLAMGHPTHAFDLDTLEGAIVVRLAREGERLRLLDGSEKILTADDLVVADEKKALALAGVMGGWDSRVTEATRNILVEAAWFDPAAIRRSSRRHGLHTDASHRFERGADLGAAALANRLVTRAIVAACGGTVTGAMTDVTVPEAELRTTLRPAVTLRVEVAQRLLGDTVDGGPVPAGDIEQYLAALGCHLEPGDDALHLSASLPSWRLDLEREIDLIEEIARVYGYNRFADTLPSFAGGVVALPHADRESRTRDLLLSLGWTEAISSTFASAAAAAEFTSRAAVPMGNPLSAEAEALRPTLLTGMLTMLERNLTRDVPAVRLWELGTVFTGNTHAVHEEPALSLGAYGAPVPGALYSADDALFFELKGALEQLLSRFGTGPVRFRADDLPAWIEPGRGAAIDLGGVTLGWFGELRSALREQRKLRERVVLAELNLPHLFRYPLRQPLAKEPSRFQAVERDLSFLFPDRVQWSDVTTAVRSIGIAEMTRLEPIEIFRDAKGRAIPAGEYSLLLRMHFQAADRTLREEEVAGWVDVITTELTSIGGRQRGPESSR